MIRHFLSYRHRHHPHLHSFPTRRSSDLTKSPSMQKTSRRKFLQSSAVLTASAMIGSSFSFKKQDRKSTRLNSSHMSISYAVFCLKKKKPIVLLCRYRIGFSL